MVLELDELRGIRDQRGGIWRVEIMQIFRNKWGIDSNGPVN